MLRDEELLPFEDPDELLLEDFEDFEDFDPDEYPDFEPLL